MRRQTSKALDSWTLVELEEPLIHLRNSPMRYKVDVDAEKRQFCHVIETLLKTELKNQTHSAEALSLSWRTCLHLHVFDYQTGAGTRDYEVQVWADSGKPEQDHPQPGSSPLSLEVVGVNPQRSTVIARCTDEALEELFQHLLLAISETWPGTVEQLKRQGFDFPDYHTPGPKDEELGTESGNDEDTVPFPGFPKTRKGKERWQKSYAVILETQDAYRGMYNDLGKDEPLPNFEELREALRRDVPAWCRWDKAPQEDTIRKIIRAGKGGHLRRRFRKS
jgi:hypothetical protein